MTLGINSASIQLNPAEIATICHGVLCALSHLHDMKIMHLDVKGRNIMVNNHGHVYLTDLGSSTLITVVEIVAARPSYNRIPRHEVGRVIRVTMPQAITDFLLQCIEWDPAKRASPSKLLEHEFPQTKETPEVLGDLVPFAKSPDLQLLALLPKTTILLALKSYHGYWTKRTPLKFPGLFSRSSTWISCNRPVALS